MNYRQKLGYMAVGGVLVLIGMIAANLRADNLIGTTEVAFGSVLALAGITSVFAATSKQTAGGDRVDEVITCRKLRIVDEKGQSAIVLDTTEKDGGCVAVFDNAGHPAVALSAIEYGGSVAVFHKAGRPVGDLSAVKCGGIVGVYSETGQQVARLNTDEFWGGGFVGVFDEAGKEAVSLSAPGYGAKVSVYDKAGENVVGMSASDDRGGSISLSDKAGEPALLLGVNKSGGTVVVLDKAKIMATLP